MSTAAIVPHAEAAVHIEDRGYQFADGVYEVCEVATGFIVDMTRHLDRLDRSLGELRIAWPMRRKALRGDARGGPPQPRRQRPGLSAGDPRRGAARPCLPGAGDERRRWWSPPSAVDPAADARRAETGIKVITVPENRWERVDIKTVGLLPNVLAKQKAKEAGAQEAWFVDDRRHRQGGRARPTPGSSPRMAGWSPAPAEHGILRGVTRTTMFDVRGKGSV